MRTLFLVLTATAEVFASWVVLAICLMGLGLGLRRAFGPRVIDGDRCLMGMWMGFAATIPAPADLAFRASGDRVGNGSGGGSGYSGTGLESRGAGDGSAG